MDPKHSLGEDFYGIIDTVKDSLKDAAILGVGATAGIMGTDYLLSKILVRNGMPIVSTDYSPWAIAAMGLVAGALVKDKLNEDLGLGIMAGTVGVAVSALIAKFTAPAVAATTQASAGPAAATAGFGFGRAHSDALSGVFAGYQHSLGDGGVAPYSIGSDVAAAQMFNGTTVQFEEKGGLGKSTLQFEETGSLAGALN